MFFNTKWDTKFYTRTKQQIFPHFGKRVRNFEVTGLKTRRMLFGQFIREIQKFFPPTTPTPRSWGCWPLRVHFSPSLGIKTVLLVLMPSLFHRGAHRNAKSDYWLTLKIFSWNFEYFSKIWKFQEKHDMYNGHFHMKIYVHLCYLTEFFLEWKVFQIKVAN
jgi:hypothetical protein